MNRWITHLTVVLSCLSGLLPDPTTATTCSAQPEQSTDVPCESTPLYLLTYDHGWWVGIDGSRIATVPTYKGQGAQFGRTTVDNWILTRYPGSNAPKSPADFRKEFAHIQPLLATRADDAGLRRQELVKEYEGKPGYRWILLDEILPNFPAPK